MLVSRACLTHVGRLIAIAASVLLLTLLIGAPPYA